MDCILESKTIKRHVLALTPVVNNLDVVTIAGKLELTSIKLSS